MLSQHEQQKQEYLCATNEKQRRLATPLTRRYPCLSAAPAGDPDEGLWGDWAASVLPHGLREVVERPRPQIGLDQARDGICSAKAGILRNHVKGNSGNRDGENQELINLMLSKEAAI